MVSDFIFFVNFIRMSLCVSVFAFLYVYVCLVFSVFFFFLLFFYFLKRNRKMGGWEDCGRTYGRGTMIKNVLSGKYLQLKNVK